MPPDRFAPYSPTRHFWRMCCSDRGASCSTAPSSIGAAADCSSRTRSMRFCARGQRGGRRDRPHRAHRADLREGRIDDAAHAARPRPSSAGGAAGRRVRPVACGRCVRPAVCRTGATRSSNRTFRRAGTDVEALNNCRTDAQRRLIFEEFFLFQAGLLVRKRRNAADRKARTAIVDDRVRESARRVLPFKLTDGSEARASRHRHRHAARAADEPAAPGRRWSRQDDRGAHRGRRGDGEPFPGRVHGADRNSGGPALPDDSSAARRVTVPCGVADRQRGRVAPARGAGGARERRRQPRRRHARAGRGGGGVP